MTRSRQCATPSALLPWNNIYHCTGCTYGTWLPGDPRGFRTRHHREHVDGDYKNPPEPGVYEQRFAHSRTLLKRAPVFLSRDAREVALQIMADTLTRFGATPYAMCLDSHHFHILAQFPNHDPRRLIGHAKRRSARLLADREFVTRGGVWAVRSRAEPIKDQQHAKTALNYILRHSTRGACVWRRDEL